MKFCEVIHCLQLKFWIKSSDKSFWPISVYSYQVVLCVHVYGYKTCINLTLIMTNQGRSTHSSLYNHGCIGFMANLTSICKPHPFQLRGWDCVVATRVRLLAEQCPKVLICLTNHFQFPLVLFGRPTKQFNAVSRVLDSDNGCGYTIYVKTSSTTLFA